MRTSGWPGAMFQRSSGRIITRLGRRHGPRQRDTHRGGITMIAVAGIFTSQAGVERAIVRLCMLGIPEEHINCLFPGASMSELETVPTTDAVQHGIGKFVGGLIGGAHGAFGGLVGAAVVSAVLPGVGPVMGLGLAAAALLGAGGVVAGAAVGGALEDSLEVGLPKDELFIYEDALRQGRAVLIVMAKDTSQADAVRAVLASAGAESLDAAREHCLLGLRDSAAEEYTAECYDFGSDEPLYRQGFEAALQPAIAGKSYAEALDFLRMHYTNAYREEAFQRGYARGRAYYEGLRD